MDKFILERKAYRAVDVFPTVRVSREAYDAAAVAAAESGLSLSKVVSRMIEFAAARLEFVDAVDSD